MAFEKKTSISPGMFMDQYRQFAVKNRVTTFDVLFKAYCVSERDTQLILGGKIVLEYGMAIEELFAFAMACHKLCVANVNNQAEGKDAFFSNLFEYYPRDLFAFMQKHDFNSSLVEAVQAATG